MRLLLSGMAVLMAFASTVYVNAEEKMKTALGEIVVGKPAPDFNLNGVDGKEHKLSDWQGKKNVVVVISRANWCPYCMGHLKSLQKNYGEIKELNSEIVIIFREEKDGLEGLKKSQKTTGAEFPLLNDIDAQKTSAYQPYGVYIIDTKGNIVFADTGVKTKRVSAETILGELKKLK